MTSNAETTPQKKVLFVASTGGHLAQLFRFADTFNASAESLWVTFDTEQSRSLLQGRNVIYVPYVASRDVKGIVRTYRLMRKALQDARIEQVISTGAAVALGVFPWALLHRVPRLYIESVSRTHGPSATGKIVESLRLADLRTQHSSWATGRWQLHPSVLNQFHPVARVASQTSEGFQESPRLFITLGTIRPYRFDSLIDGVLRTGLANDQTIWQVGVTTRTDLPGAVHIQMTSDDFTTATRQADVVITHSGVGTILQLLESGIYPVVVPRRRRRREHVDDHQTQIANLVKQAGIAKVLEAEDLNKNDILDATAWAVSPSIQEAQ